MKEDLELYESLIVDTINIFYEDTSNVDQEFVENIHMKFVEYRLQLTESVTEESLNDVLIDLILGEGAVSLGAKIGGVFSKKQALKNRVAVVKDYHEKTKALHAQSGADLVVAHSRVDAAAANRARSGHTFYSAHLARKEHRAAKRDLKRLESTHKYHAALVKHSHNLVGVATRNLNKGRLSAHDVDIGGSTKSLTKPNKTGSGWARAHS